MEIEYNLNRWLSRYIAMQDNAAAEVRARRPLRDGRVTVNQGGDDGILIATVDLQPHFQVEEVDFTLSLNIDIPSLDAVVVEGQQK